jgi:hypothetical protein
MRRDIFTPIIAVAILLLLVPFSTAMFTQADTVIKDVHNPQNLNRYSFEENSPYNHVDPTGHTTCSIWSGCVRFDFFGLKIYFGGSLDETDTPVKTDTTKSNNQIQLIKSSSNNEEGQWITDLFIGAGTAGTSLKSSFKSSTATGTGTSGSSGNSISNTRDISQNTFRNNLAEATGGKPYEGAEEHHIIPKNPAVRNIFNDRGISNKFINSPENGMWVKQGHGASWDAYQKNVVNYMETNPYASADDIVDHAKAVSEGWYGK